MSLGKFTTQKRNSYKYKPFSVFGLELEFCIVEKGTFKIKSFARNLFKNLNGKYSNTFFMNGIEISNEMVDHVIEFKPKVPEKDFQLLEKNLTHVIDFIKKELSKNNLTILPLSFHPFMKPEEAQMWRGKERAVYKTYDKLFGFNTHSFSNMQSLQLTLPYSSSEEMILLHNSIRLVLPFVKQLSASSPFYEGKLNGEQSNRLREFEHSQSSVNEKISQPITDYLHSEKDYISYMEVLYDICKNNNVKNIKPQWFNSQGSMIKYNFNAIEIRTCDIQESVKANIALAEFLFKFVQYVYYNIPNKNIDNLYSIWEGSTNNEYLSIFGYKDISNKEFLFLIADKLDLLYKQEILSIIDKNLSQRIIENPTDFLQKLEFCSDNNLIY